MMFGGSHEKRRRPGTENVAAIVGLAKALEIAGQRMDAEHQHLNELADFFIMSLMKAIPDVRFNGPRKNRIPQTVNVAFEGIGGESIILSLDMEGVAVSSGSACTSGAVEPSHVLMAMGIPETVGHGAIRFSMGRGTTKQQLERVLDLLPPIIERLRQMSPVYQKQH